MFISNVILETFFEDINDEDILRVGKIYLAIGTVLLFSFLVIGSFSLGLTLIRYTALLGIIFISISLFLLIYYILKFIKTLHKLTKK